LHLTELAYTHLRGKLDRSDLSCEKLVDLYIENIHEQKSLNAYITVFEDNARQRAIEIDNRIAGGQAGMLAGMVVAIKDNIVMKGVPTTCGSRILSNFVPPYDATVIRKLLEQDAILIGKTNLDEFAMGSSTETSNFAATRNPHDADRVPGGSSGGSASAVAAGLCCGALGSDTGGSIRQPASFCGVVGLKPTYGRVSRFGLVAFASSLDQIGPLSQTVSDNALLLKSIAGYDPNDSTCAKVAVPDYDSFLQQEVKGLKIGKPVEYFSRGLDPEINRAIENVLESLARRGAEIVEVSLPNLEYAISAYYIIATAEASSNLERFDGARYGFRSAGAKNLEEMYVKSRSEGFGPEVKRRIMLGTFVLSSGYYDAYYRKAMQVRTLIKNDFDRVLKQVDCLITPTSPTTAFKLEEKLDDPLQMYLSDIYTVSVNLAGLPALSLPCAKDHQGLPVGIQFIAKPFDEGMLFRIADHVEGNHTC
jgi:aspartyl-tRNA(Asn)/glutamyl-tRNA(Gln) amidotransferase subunit A